MGVHTERPLRVWARFTDKVPDAETKGVRFGVQIRDLELVIPAYESNGGRVAWSAYRGKRPSTDELRERLLALHREYGHAPYAANLLEVFGVVFPALRGPRDRIDRAQDRMAHFVSVVLERAHKHKQFLDAEHHVFRSEWVGMIYEHLGLTKPAFDPHLAAPVTALLKADLFAEPANLVPEVATEPPAES